MPSTATARVRELSRGSRRKTDVIDAAAAACVAALQGDATPIRSEDHTTVLAMLEERRANLATGRIRIANQLHAVLRSCPGRRRSWPSPLSQQPQSFGRFARRLRVSEPARSSPKTSFVTCGPSTRPWPTSNNG